VCVEYFISSKILIYNKILSVLFFATEEILSEFSLAELKPKTTISEEEYASHKAYFKKESYKG